MVGRETASQMASASRASFLPPRTYGPHILRGNQAHLVTQSRQGARPIVRAVTGFDADEAAFDLSEIRPDVSTPETPLNDRASVIVHAMHLEHVFRDIKTDGGDGHHVLLVG